MLPLGHSQINQLQFRLSHTPSLSDDTGVFCQCMRSGEEGRIHRQMAMCDTHSYLAQVFALIKG